MVIMVVVVGCWSAIGVVGGEGSWINVVVGCRSGISVVVGGGSGIGPVRIRRNRSTVDSESTEVVTGGSTNGSGGVSMIVGT